MVNCGLYVVISVFMFLLFFKIFIIKSLRKRNAFSSSSRFIVIFIVYFVKCNDVVVFMFVMLFVFVIILLRIRLNECVSLSLFRVVSCAFRMSVFTCVLLM